MEYTALGYKESPTKQKHREAILSSALDLFVAYGIHAVTMDDIAVASDLTLRSIYNYYDSKEDIAIDIEIACMAAFQAEKIDIPDFENGLEEASYWIRFFGQWFMDHPKITSFLAMFDYAFTEHFPNFRLTNFLDEKDVGHILYSSVIRGIRDGSIYPYSDPSEFSYTIAQVAYAYIQKYVYHLQVPTFETMSRQIGQYEIFIEILINSMRNIK